MSVNPLRNIPSVNDLLDNPKVRTLVERLSPGAVMGTVRSVLDEVRGEVQAAASEKTLPSISELADRIARRVMETEQFPLQGVVNATGVLLGAGLGGAPLAEEAIREISAAGRDYANLELDLASGRPAGRQRAVEGLLRELTGAEAALVLSSHAAAVLVTLAAVAGSREVVVSRGELGETAEGDRLPEVIAAAGAVLREVGTTNRTRPGDYEEAMGEATAALMLFHAGHFAVVGSQASVSLAELVEMGRRRGVPVIHDMDNGALIDLEPLGVTDEPVVGRSIKAGADLVLARGDQLLGGPACGIIVGRRALVEKIQQHPIARAVRVGKLTLAGLAATLRLYRDPEAVSRAVPILHLLSTSADNLRNRAERLAPQIAATEPVAEAEAVASTAQLGQWPLAGQELPTWCISVRGEQMGPDRLAAGLRSGSPPVIGRVEEERLLLDLRTVIPRQDQSLVAAFESLGTGSA